MRDLVELHVADKGGPTNISEAEHAIIRRCAMLVVESVVDLATRRAKALAEAPVVNSSNIETLNSMVNHGTDAWSVLPTW